jgi:hypothetical protein
LAIMVCHCHDFADVLSKVTNYFCFYHTQKCLFFLN